MDNQKCSENTPSDNAANTPILLSPFINKEGVLSGAKSILFGVCILASVWLIKDLIHDYPLTDQHTYLFCALLFVGLINRMSARGNFKFSFGRDGLKIEKEEDHHDAKR